MSWRTVCNRFRPLALGLMVGACTPEPAIPESAGTTGDDEAPPECRSDPRLFVLRALPWLRGHRPAGVLELAMLAGRIEAIDAAGGDGRAEFVTQMASGPAYLRLWSEFLRDHFRVDRAGHRHAPHCHSARNQPEDRGELAAWIREHPPTEPWPGEGSWTHADLVRSSLWLDDLSPLFRAHLLTMPLTAIDDENALPHDLEAARRLDARMDFEAIYLGRNSECRECHRPGYSPTNDPQAALDRFWPSQFAPEPLVYGKFTGQPAQTLQLDAAFRHAGSVGGELHPWGSRACGRLQPQPTPDPLPGPAQLAGIIEGGNPWLVVESRLARGFAELRSQVGDTGFKGPQTPETALAWMVAQHFVDEVWRALCGRPVTLEHGYARTVGQRDRLDQLTQVFIAGGYGLRPLLVHAMTRSTMAIDAEGHCTVEGPGRVLDPFGTSDTLEDLVHRRRARPWLSVAAHAMGWPPFDLASADDGEQLLRSLGGQVTRAETMHAGSDWLTLLAYREATGDGHGPAWAGEMAFPEGDVVDHLVARAELDPQLKLEDLVVALRDRLLCDTQLDAAEVTLAGECFGIPIDQPALSIPSDRRELGLRRLAGAWLLSPQLLLSGAELLPPVGVAAPSIRLPGLVQSLEHRSAAGAPRPVPGLIGQTETNQ